ncbi:hypothetical protein L0F63_002193 [Massospora cicadina]|nr:hypothetical protein L0F63_002193 [Massospora cicadina]
MIDIHAAPLSQNGFDNSGKAGKVEFLSDDTSGPRMLDVLRKVTDLFSTREFKETVTAIELVNEPANSLLDFEKLKAFYEDGYKVIRKRSKGVMVTFHDAFCSLEEWEYLSSKSNILLDTHIYNAFDLRFLTFTHNDHKEHTCTFVKQLSRSNSLMPTVVGEWKGSRFAGTFVDHASPPLPPDYDFKNDDCAIHDDLASFTQEHQLWLAEFFIHQMSVYENAGSGWFF